MNNARANEKPLPVCSSVEVPEGQANFDLTDLVAQTVIDRLEDAAAESRFFDLVTAKIESWKGVNYLRNHRELVQHKLVVGVTPALAPPPVDDRTAVRSPLYYKYENDDLSMISTRLLVSSFKSGEGDGGIFELNFRQNTYRQVLYCDGRGLAKCDNRYIVATRETGVFVLDEELNVVDEHKISNLDLHGIAVGPDGLIYIVETRHNRIGIYTLDPFRRVSEIAVSIDPDDVNHINDICFHNGRLLLSMFSTRERWRENFNRGIFDGAIVEYDYQEKTAIRTVAANLKMPHTLKMVNGELSYCESFSLNIKRASEIIGQYFGYTRGFDFDGEYFFVGQSRLRHRSRHTETTISGDSGVHILAPKEHVSRFVPLPTTDIYAVLVL